MFIDKSTIYFSNGKQFCGKTFVLSVLPRSLSKIRITILNLTLGCHRFYDLAPLPVLVPIYLGEIQFIIITVIGVQVLCIICTELPEKCSSITNVYISLLISLVVSYPDNSYHRRTYLIQHYVIKFVRGRTVVFSEYSSFLHQ
jgi:hypothetical protein